MKLIRTEDAAGQVLCHDITQIIPGEFKGARFRKGHVIQPEDIPVLLSIGKTSTSGRRSPASSTRTKPPRCCTRPLRARTSTAPSRRRARSSSSPTATAC